MDLNFKEKFLQLWEKYFGNAELPIVFFYTDNEGDAEPVEKAENKGCFIGELAKVRNGVAVTSIDMAGRINGWFIHKSVHPVLIGLGSVIKKPVVVNEEIKIREILNMSLLLDHDAIDGAPMSRFVKELNSNLETGIGL